VGQYPDYNQVIPAESSFISHILLSRNQFVESLERAALISRESGRSRSNVALMEMKEGILSLSAQAADEGAISEQLSISLNGEEIDINYNVRYLLDALKVMEEENIMLRLTGPASPGVIIPYNDDEAAETEDYLYLLLPIRVAR
jgi:DNA polymerase-3 subunit beta